MDIICILVIVNAHVFFQICGEKQFVIIADGQIEISRKAQKIHPHGDPSPHNRTAFLTGRLGFFIRCLR